MVATIFKWSLFFAFHSILASHTAKLLCKNHCPTLYPYYRLLYNIIALVWSVALLSTILFDSQTTTAAAYFQALPVRCAGLLLLSFGLWVVWKAFAKYDTAEFLGLRQLHESNSDTPSAPQHDTLQTTGWNGVVRHPLYFGTILAVLGTFIVLPNHHTLCFLISVCLYLPVGIYLEEQKLIQQFGEPYHQYKKKVKCVIPYVF